MTADVLTPAELRRRRNALNMSQARLAQALGVSTNTVHRWEAGTRAIPAMLALALDQIAAQSTHTQSRHPPL